MHWISTSLAAAAFFTQAAAAEVPSGTIDLSEAWVPASSEPGGDVPLYMTMANHGDALDSLMRARCPTDLADFTEKHTTDRGEGATTMREVKSFPVPPKETMALKPGGNHLMLLHVRQPLREGQTFACSIVFQKSGTSTVEVKVVASEAKAGP